MPDRSTSSGAVAFLSRDFRLYQLARVLVIIGAEAQTLAVAWLVYQITHSALYLGYTGLVLFLPGLLFLLPAGHVADRFDRRLVILVCYALQAFCTRDALFLCLARTARRLADLLDPHPRWNRARLQRSRKLGAYSASCS